MSTRKTFTFVGGGAELLRRVRYLAELGDVDVSELIPLARDVAGPRPLEEGRSIETIEGTRHGVGQVKYTRTGASKPGRPPKRRGRYTKEEWRKKREAEKKRRQRQRKYQERLAQLEADGRHEEARELKKRHKAGRKAQRKGAKSDDDGR